MSRGRLTIIPLIFITLSLVLSACGRKGDLFLPETTPTDMPDTSQQQKQQQKQQQIK